MDYRVKVIDCRTCGGGGVLGGIRLRPHGKPTRRIARTCPVCQGKGAQLVRRPA